MKYEVVYYNPQDHERPGRQIWWPATSDPNEAAVELERARLHGDENVRRTVRISPTMSLTLQKGEVKCSKVGA